MFAAGFLQTGERIAAFSSRFAAGAATDFSFFHVIPDITFTEVVVQGNPGLVQYSKQLMLVVPQTLQGLVERLITGFGATKLFKPGAYLFCPIGVRIDLVLLEIGVELPDLFPDPVDGLLMACIERNEPIDDTLGMDPAQDVVKHIELTRIVAHDHQIARDSLCQKSTHEGPFGHSFSMTRTRYAVWCQPVLRRVPMIEIDLLIVQGDLKRFGGFLLGQVLQCTSVENGAAFDALTQALQEVDSTLRVRA